MLDYLSRAQSLFAAGQPFVLATVLRAHAPTSAKAGMKAIITADGTLAGWVGGSCTQPAVVRESLKALNDGSPRFLRLGPPEMLRGDTPGVIEVPLTCVSGGTLEIYLDPHLPPLQLLVIGHLPVVEALVALSKDMEYAVTVMGEEVTLERFPRADRALDRLDFSHLKPSAGGRLSAPAYIVVATHGNYDEEALLGALKTNAPYIALVASKKRAASVIDYLREAGIAPDQIARIKFPAGLDIGAVTPAEIALSILAEIVQVSRQAAPPTIAATAEPVALEAKDPVCGMMVEIAGARYTSSHNGQTVYFCSAGCKRSFDKEPETYAAGLA